MRKSMVISLLVFIFSCSKATKEKSKEILLDLPFKGKISREQLDKFYPNLMDTIKDLCLFKTERLEMEPSENVIVTLLHNEGPFDQIILCTHNKKFELLDSHYIGKATDFDNGKSHTIDFSILNKKEIEFKQVDYKDIGINTEKIDTVKYQKDIFTIIEKGKIKLK